MVVQSTYDAEPMTALPHETPADTFARLNLSSTENSLEHVDSMDACPAALSARLLDKLDLEFNEGQPGELSEEYLANVEHLVAILPNVFRGVSEGESFRGEGPVKREGLEVDMDTDAVAVLVRAAALPADAAHADLHLSVAQTLEQMAPLVHAELRAEFLDGGGLSTLAGYANPAHSPLARRAAAAGLANLTMLKEAAEDGAFRCVLLAHPAGT
jgi:hypothetical protein